MPGPPVVEVAGDTNWPERVDAVVVGGGIVGTSTALELADQGLSVALCEKGGIGHEQSSRNWGWVRACLNPARADHGSHQSMKITNCSSTMRHRSKLSRKFASDTP